MVRRNIGIALGIVCIILVAAFCVVAYVGHSPTNTDSMTSLQGQLTSPKDTWNDKGFGSPNGMSSSDYSNRVTAP